MDLNGSIESAENKYRQILEDFFILHYKEDSLPSHGINHHRRVWNYSKELLEIIPLKSGNQLSSLVPDLIIASYLHDIGMSVDAGVRHGKFSRDMCQQFLITNSFPESDYPDLFQAIENHDNKEYSGNIVQNDLLAILSVADDLDAFGLTGAYRYAEIYLIRRIPFEKIGELILENAARRFENLLKTISFNQEFTARHKWRYDLLVEFFKNYNQQLPSYKFGTGMPHGYCGVIELIRDMTGTAIDTDLEDITSKFINDPVISSFFTSLKMETEIQ